MENLPKTNKTKRLLLASFVLPAVILLGMTVQPVTTLMTGTPIALKTMPFDPKSLFYGDYIKLQYEVQQLPASLFDKAILKKHKAGAFNSSPTTVYIVLEKKDGNVFEATKVHETKPSEGIYLQGTIEGEPITDDRNQPPYFNVELNLDTISKYYVEEGTGKKFEQQSGQGQLLAHMKWKDGYVILTSVEAWGK
ncbi:MAG: GDYXXLXY domain-containing protein [Bacillota bacterium]|nr:GDYXXLXY domain-containing protein [Bacillota bacterium]